jgi:ABC-type transporter Mla subunit MlaD
LTIDGAAIRDVLIGVGVLLAGLGIVIASAALARLFGRLNRTLDEVDKQVAALSGPVVETLAHVGGIADSADTAVARLGATVGTLESVAESVSSTAKLASDAVAPGLINFGVALAGITAGLRRLVSGKDAPEEDFGNG